MTATRKLFVYGTLRPADTTQMGLPMRQRLLSEGTHVGAARFPGILLDLGKYPGLIEDGAGSEVLGDIISLQDPASTWPWLDEYEGVDPARPETGEYVRAVRSVRLAPSGEVISAWVYILRQRPAQPRTISSGNWLLR